MLDFDYMVRVIVSIDTCDVRLCCPTDYPKVMSTVVKIDICP